MSVQQTNEGHQYARTALMQPYFNMARRFLTSRDPVLQQKPAAPGPCTSPVAGLKIIGDRPDMPFFDVFAANEVRCIRLS
jgi:hypothetical protein